MPPWIIFLALVTTNTTFLGLCGFSSTRITPT